MMTRRGGYSLVELLVVISVGSVVAGVVVGVLAMAYPAHRAARKYIEAAAAVERLDVQFRRDCHAATDFQPLAPGERWRLVLPDDTSVEYRSTPGRLQRIERTAGEVRYRETFFLWRASIAALTLEEQGEARLVCLELTRSEDAKPLEPDRPVRIEAVLGLDHRFSSRPPGGKK